MVSATYGETLTKSPAPNFKHVQTPIAFGYSGYLESKPADRDVSQASKNAPSICWENEKATVANNNI